MAAHHAGIVIKNALFRLPAKVNEAAYPWVTYTDPELAQIGMNAAEAKRRHNDIRITTWPFGENDRAIAEGRGEGLIKVVMTAKGKILGVGIVGPQAGELIQVWGLAISAGLKIGKVANMIAPYPTLGEANKRVAGEFFTPTLFGGNVGKIVKFLSKFG
jgi:pyruvate/2-oxoglutarate dehydrogenase complex dihydrolipoamide dehydrogenase (E3) component